MYTIVHSEICQTILDHTLSTSTARIKSRISYLLGKGGYVFGTVGLSVCLSVNNITQKVMNGLG